MQTGTVQKNWVRRKARILSMKWTTRIAWTDQERDLRQRYAIAKLEIMTRRVEDAFDKIKADSWSLRCSSYRSFWRWTWREAWDGRPLLFRCNARLYASLHPWRKESAWMVVRQMRFDSSYLVRGFPIANASRKCHFPTWWDDVAIYTYPRYKDGWKDDRQCIKELPAFHAALQLPPFCTGDKGSAGVGRREIGHGHLAWRALKNQIPEDYPYTVRLMSEILESNGSSSMATVCAGTLALMDAGVPWRNL